MTVGRWEVSSRPDDNRPGKLLVTARSHSRVMHLDRIDADTDLAALDFEALWSR